MKRRSVINQTTLKNMTRISTFSGKGPLSFIIRKSLPKGLHLEHKVLVVLAVAVHYSSPLTKI